MATSSNLGCLGSIIRLFFPRREDVASGAGPLPYRRKDYLLSKGEGAFFAALQQAAGDEHLIFAKVRLADLLWMPKGTTSRQSHFNRIQSKHVDFLLCDRTAVRPALAIELDDASHDRPDRQSRDAFLDAALSAAGLPLLHVRARAGYDPGELRVKIRAAITPVPPA